MFPRATTFMMIYDIWKKKTDKAVA
jgi:hypothetical protein